MNHRLKEVLKKTGKDPLCDEGIAYATALQAAGVSVTLNNYPGLPHAFYLFPTLKQTAAYHAAMVEWVAGLLRNADIACTKL